MIKQPSDPISQKLLKELIYGQPGIGKTTLALTAPSPLLIDCDRGIHRLSAKDRKAYIEVNSWNDIISVTQEDLRNYDTLVIDTAGRALDFLAQKIMLENPKAGYQGNLSIQGYGVLKTQFNNFIATIEMLGKHLIFVAHDKESSDGDQKIIRPDIVGGSLAIIMRSMDLVGYIESRNGKRTINFNPTERNWGKNTCNLPIIEFDKTNGTGTMKEVFDAYFKRNDEQVIMLGEYESLMSVISEGIENITDPETAKEVSDKISGMEQIWDSKLQGQTKLRAKLKELGLKWNKVTEVFEVVEPTPQA